MSSKKIVIAGGSGFLGTSFKNFAKKSGYKVIILSRNPKETNGVRWDGKSLGKWTDQLIDADAVINFTGRSVNCIHNEKNRKEIIKSRINSVKIIDKAIQKIPKENRPKLIIQASAIAIYGNSDNLCDEYSPIINTNTNTNTNTNEKGFLAEVCKAWENEFFKINLENVRKCILRIGLVIGSNGGLLLPLKKITKFFLGGSVGNGKQFMSWIHIEDFNNMIMECINNIKLNGIFNATAPNPVTNQKFMKEMRRVMHRPWCPPAPSFLVKLSAKFILKTEGSLALESQNSKPKRFQESGFKFKFPNLDHALREILKK